MTPTRSQVLEAIQDALEREGWSISAAIVSGKVFTSHDMSARRAQAALLALEADFYLVPKGPEEPLLMTMGYVAFAALADRMNASRDHAQSTEKARAVDGLADPQGTGEGR